MSTIIVIYGLLRLTIRCSSASIARPVIPKRGEKEFEPSTTGGSGLQRHVLDRARSAMFDALRATRTTSRYVLWRAWPNLMLTT